MEIEIIRILPKNNTIEFAVFLNSFLNKVKMLHWYTLNFDLHKILNKTYDNLNENFDKLQEEIIGTSNMYESKFPIFDFKSTQILVDDYLFLNSDKDIISFYKKITLEFKNILNSIEFNNYISSVQSGINNTKEDIMSEINKSLYLISMINI
jgi:DNA-binding ferritin-like protein